MGFKWQVIIFFWLSTWSGINFHQHPPCWLNWKRQKKRKNSRRRRNKAVSDGCNLSLRNLLPAQGSHTFPFSHFAESLVFNRRWRWGHLHIVMYLPFQLRMKVTFQKHLCRVKLKFNRFWWKITEKKKTESSFMWAEYAQVVYFSSLAIGIAVIKAKNTEESAWQRNV